MLRPRTLAFLLLLATAQVVAQEEAPPTTDDMMAAAISHYDSGDFASAANLLEQILEREPRNGTAAYELALTYQANGNLDGCADVARQYLRKLRKDEAQVSLLPQLSMLQGSCLSQAGQTRKALRAFRDGLKKNPDDYGLNFNISITLLNDGEIEKATTHLQRAVEADPLHPSPYYILGIAYQDSGQRLKSMMSLLTFLQREFNTPRCVPAAQAVIEQMYSGVTSEGGEATVLFGGDDSEGLSTLDIGLSLVAVSTMEDGQVKEPVAASMAIVIESFIGFAADLTDDVEADSFIARRLLPDIKGVAAEELDTPYAYFVLTVAGVRGAGEWLDENREETDRLVEYFQAAEVRRYEGVE